METWGLIGISLVLYGVLRLVFGPLPQDPAYHILADTRLCGFIPRAGDVLTNLSILAAGVAGLLLWRRVHVEPRERAAYALLVAGMLLTALGSRIGTGVAIACLLLLRRGRYSGAGWLWAALVLDVIMTVAERLDNEIYSATGMFVSGHNVKHLLAGVLLGCTLAWLLLREPSPPSGDRP